MKNLALLSTSLCLGFLVALSGCTSEAPKDAGDNKSGENKSEEKGSGTSEVSVKWLDSYEDALAKSKESGKPILAEFTGSDWCPPCKMLHKEVFENPAFASWAAENVVLLELDYPRNKELPAGVAQQNEMLKNKYNISGFPTVMFLDSDGEVLNSSTGYDRSGADAWIKKADEQLADAT